jgi:hypothetical protein
VQSTGRGSFDVVSDMLAPLASDWKKSRHAIESLKIIMAMVKSCNLHPREEEGSPSLSSSIPVSMRTSGIDHQGRWQWGNSETLHVETCREDGLSYHHE